MMGKSDGQRTAGEGLGPSAPRRTKGSGGLKKVRDGVWRVDIEVGRDPVTKRRRRVSRTVYGTREEAEVVAARLRVAKFEDRVQTGKTSARSIGALMDQYRTALESGTIEVAPSTVVTSRSAMRTMASTQLPDGRTFGSIRLSKLTWKDIEEMYGALRSGGRSADWIRRCATVLTQALELGRKRGLIDSNPAKDAQRPCSRRRKPHAPSADEIVEVLERADRVDPEVADAVRVLASTGMRRGELLALRWSDVDMASAEITVEAALVDGGPGIGIVRKATKTSDWRDVPLTTAALAALQRQRHRTEEALARSHGDDGYVFCSSGSPAVPLRPDTFSDRWLAARGQSEMTIQHVRHFAATAMLDAGESYRTVADILGNSESTLRLHYDGRTDVGKRRAISALELD